MTDIKYANVSSESRMAEKRQDASDTTSTILDVTSINTAVVINKMKTAKFISDSFGI